MLEMPQSLSLQIGTQDSLSKRSMPARCLKRLTLSYVSRSSNEIESFIQIPTASNQIKALASSFIEERSSRNKLINRIMQEAEL